MDDKRTGIPTTYAGVEFRSRLEAKWAAFFDLVGWKWTYEPLDYPGWIPDFLIDTPGGQILIEVKPEALWDACERELCSPSLWPAQIPYDIVICGHSPFLRETEFGHAAMGLYSEAIRDESEWLRNNFADEAALRHDDTSFVLGPAHALAPGMGGLNHPIALWRKAGNATKWKSERWQDRCDWRG